MKGCRPAWRDEVEEPLVPRLEPALELDEAVQVRGVVLVLLLANPYVYGFDRVLEVDDLLEAFFLGEVALRVREENAFGINPKLGRRAWHSRKHGR
ncbi:V4 protein [Persimmon circular DNA virus]|nr:V4 protein [Persimmon circular DNA virus]